MSILLDALKQSQNSDNSAQQFDLQRQQQTQLQALKRYRQLALLFGFSLLAIVIIVAGYLAGQWLQRSTVVETSKPEIVQSTNGTKPEPELNMPAKEHAGPAEVVESVDKAIVTQPVVPAPMYIQTAQGLQQVVLNERGEYVVVAEQRQTKLATQEPSKGSSERTQILRNEATQAPSSTKAEELDLSQYKVLGKPLANTKPAAVQNPELKAVPDKLKDAFAKAVQATEQTQEYEVTQASKSSSRVQPVELLPDGLQAMIPRIKYQAHIYSSTVDKRWIKLNGRELYEGDSIGALTLREITPEQSVLDFDGYEFSLKALQDWPN